MNAVDRGAEDGEFSAVHVEGVTVLVSSEGVAERSGQGVRIVRAGGLHNCHQAAGRFEDLDPTVIADDSVAANHECFSGADRDAGVLRAKTDDLVEIVLAETVPCITKCGVDSEKRLTVTPETTDVHPGILHWSSVAGLERVCGSKMVWSLSPGSRVASESSGEASTADPRCRTGTRSCRWSGVGDPRVGHVWLCRREVDAMRR